MNLYLKTWILGLFVAVVTANKFVPLSTEDKAIVEEGKKQMEFVSRESQMPRFGACWKNALDNLKNGCKVLTDESQSRMALAFTNCFLEKAGLKHRPCRKTEEISECVRDLDMKGYTTFSNFFTHTHSMCCFLQNQVWHEETSDVIVQLHQNSANVSEQLKQSNSLQQHLLKNQRKSIETQERLWSKSHELSRVLDMSKENVREVMLEFKSSTEEQRLLIMEIFDRVASLQSTLLGEFTGFYSLIFYTVAACAVYLITSTPRTNGARFWLFTVLTVNIVLERVIVMYGVNEDLKSLMDELSSVIYSRIWMCRKFSSIIALIVLAVVLYRYRDYNLINNQLLMEIKQQNLELRKFIQNKISTGTSTTELDGGLNAITPAAATDVISQLPDAQTSLPTSPSRKRTPRTPNLNGTMRSPHSYNLRQRSQFRPNPVVENETPDEFSSYVHTLALTSKTNSSKIRCMLRNPEMHPMISYD